MCNIFISYDKSNWYFVLMVIVVCYSLFISELIDLN